MPGPVVDLAIALAIALAIVPVLSIVASTRAPEAAHARRIVRSHPGVGGRLGRVLLTFVRAAVFGPAPDRAHARVTYHVWTVGTRGPATVLVVFERADVSSEWTQATVLLRPWIPFAKPRELAS